MVVEEHGLLVQDVDRGSPGQRAGLQPGDRLRRVNGHLIEDIVDLRYHTGEESFEIEFVRGGETRAVRVERGWGEELGLTFSFELADEIHTCDNKCIFCFIHQMPRGMRKSLYLMDDDYRLSFLHGNYVTLTNMSEAEFERIKEQGLSPIYVSVHATDPSLRGFLLGGGTPAPILPRLRELNAAGINVHCQIVICPGINDGKALDQTIMELSELHRSQTGLRGGVLSTAVVPVGLSKFRHNLYPVRRVGPEYAGELLKQMQGWRCNLYKSLGTRFVFPTDEWFFYAEKPVPSRRWYEDFPQFEDGVGTCRLFLDQAGRGLRRLPEACERPTKLTIVTGVLPSRIMKWFADELSRVKNLEVDVCAVINHFFGDGITVTGLLTGGDVAKAVMAHGPRGIVAIPDVTLKDGRLFLDDMTIDDVRSETGLDIRVCPSRAKEFLKDWLPQHVFAG